MALALLLRRAQNQPPTPDVATALGTHRYGVPRPQYYRDLPTTIWHPYARRLVLRSARRHVRQLGCPSIAPVAAWGHGLAGLYEDCSCGILGELGGFAP
eukprot:1155351-Pyramimonas_sp.AAC.1